VGTCFGGTCLNMDDLYSFITDLKNLDLYGHSHNSREVRRCNTAIYSFDINGECVDSLGEAAWTVENYCNKDGEWTKCQPDKWFCQELSAAGIAAGLTDSSQWTYGVTPDD